MKRLALILLTLILLAGGAHAYSLREEAVLTQKDFKEILGNKIVSFREIRATPTDGNLLVIARDFDTRDMEWFLVSPSSRRVIKKGSCPFKAFTAFSPSPAGNKALLFSRYPTAIWYLDVEKARWVLLYRNHRGEGLNILGISPLSYADDSWGYTILDRRDKDGFVAETAIFAIIPHPFVLTPLCTLKELVGISQNRIFPGRPPADRRYKTDLLLFGPEKTFVYVLKTLSKEKKGRVEDYLMHFSGNRKTRLLDRAEGQIRPLDYLGGPERVLYRVSGKDSAELRLWEGGRTITLMKGNPLTAKLLYEGLIGSVQLEKGGMSLYLGKPGDKPEKVLTVNKAYMVGFARNARRVILQNDSEIRCYRVEHYR